MKINVYRDSWDPSEKVFQMTLVRTAQTLGWTVFHAYDMRRSAKGWPDVTLVRPGELIIWELKTNRGRPSPEQVFWLNLLATVPGIESGLMRPRDWDVILNRLGYREGMETTW